MGNRLNLIIVLHGQTPFPLFKDVLVILANSLGDTVIVFNSFLTSWLSKKLVDVVSEKGLTVAAERRVILQLCLVTIMANAGSQRLCSL